MISSAINKLKAALVLSFHKFDRNWQELRRTVCRGSDHSGATAVVGVVVGLELMVANAGDCVALVVGPGGAKRLSRDHRLDDRDEAARVMAAGGFVGRTMRSGPLRMRGPSRATQMRAAMVTRWDERVL